MADQESGKRRGNPTWQKGGPSPNPRGRPRADAEQPRQVWRADSWANLFTGSGVMGRDKRLSTRHQTTPITAEEAHDLYRGNALAARIVETLPNEALREGFEICVSDDSVEARAPGTAMDRARREVLRAGSMQKARQVRADAVARASAAKDMTTTVMRRWEELEGADNLHRALCYSRAFGGGAVLIGANDGQADWEQPLDVDRVSSVDFLTALESREIVPYKWYTDPLSPKFGRPAVYQLNPTRNGLPVEQAKDVYNASLRYVHETRLLVFDGVRVSRLWHTSTTAGWGDSIFTRIYPVLRDFGITWDAAAQIITDFSQGVFRVKDLAELVAAEGKDAADAFTHRMQMVDMSRSITRSILLDAEHENFTRETTSVAGLADLMDRFITMVAADGDMPVTLLFGLSPGGMNATGESDIRLFYDRVAAWQRRKLEPQLRYLFRILFVAAGGEPDAWSVTWHPLWQPTEKEQAEAREIQQRIDHGYIEDQVYSAEEVRAQRFGGPTYSTSMHVDLSEDAEIAAGYADPEPSVEPAPVPTVPDAGAGAPAPDASVQSQAMNGAQITAMIAVVTAFAQKTIPRIAAVTMLTTGFPGLISQAQAEAMCPEEFTAPEPPPPANPFGGPPAPPPDAETPEEDATETEEPSDASVPKADAGWDESSHPRAENGQFGEAATVRHEAAKKAVDEIEAKIDEHGARVSAHEERLRESEAAVADAKDAARSAARNVREAKRELDRAAQRAAKTAGAPDEHMLAQEEHAGAQQDHAEAIAHHQEMEQAHAAAAAAHARVVAEHRAAMPKLRAEGRALNRQLDKAGDDLADAELELKMRGDAARADHVEHRGGKWVVLSEDRSRVLSSYDTEAEADERLRQVEAAKAAKAAK